MEPDTPGQELTRNDVSPPPMVPSGETPPPTTPEELEVAKAQIADLTDTLQRLQAEFENFRRRVAAERADWSRAAAAEILTQFLDVADTFEVALGHKAADADFVKGIELVYAKLVETLGEHGVEPLDPKGEPFNPRLHAAILKEASDQPSGTVLEVFQKGYLLNDRILRHAKVKVAA